MQNLQECLKIPQYNNEASQYSNHRMSNITVNIIKFFSYGKKSDLHKMGEIEKRSFGISNMGAPYFYGFYYARIWYRILLVVNVPKGTTISAWQHICHNLISALLVLSIASCRWRSHVLSLSNTWISSALTTAPSQLSYVVSIFTWKYLEEFSLNGIIGIFYIFMLPCNWVECYAIAMLTQRDPIIFT